MQLKVFLVVSILAVFQLGSAQNCESDVPTSCVEIRNSNPDSSSGYFWIRTGSSLVQHFCNFAGLSQDNPAASCNEVKELHPNLSSGDYWIENSEGQVIQVYCNMELTVGNITGGWIRVADIDMRNPNDTCPSGLNETIENSTRFCSNNISGDGCSSVTITTHDIQYSYVTGKIIGYQQKAPDAFRPYQLLFPPPTIDEVYVDGISLTHGASPREHIWTFAAALQEVITHPDNEFSLCPCTSSNNPTTINIPDFVGDDYFCETGSSNAAQLIFYPDDPLWDGEGCGSNSTCCSLNNPPWFFQQLPSPTTDDMEMRLCEFNDYSNDEDITFEQVELYIQ